jgi:hypothetical protein
MDTTQASMQTELIKHRPTLAVVGLGAIAFGIWSLIKSILYFVLVEPIFDTISSNYDDLSNSKYEAWVLVAITFAIVVMFVLIDMLLRWKVGRKAMAVSRGDKEPGVGFFILSSILLLMDMAELIMGALSIAGIIPSDEDITDQISTLLVDFTSVVMLIEMLFAAIMIRKLVKKISEGQNTEGQNTEGQNTAEHSSGAA